MPGEVARIPACSWWPAFLLVLLDTRCTVATAIGLAPRDYERRSGTLATGCQLTELHPLTINAIETLDGNRSRLLPWNLDGGRQPFHMLYREYRRVLWRAGLATTTQNLFERLRGCAGLLDEIDLDFPFRPRAGEPVFPRAERRQQRATRARDLSGKLPAKVRLYAGKAIAEQPSNSPDSLRNFFETSFRVRLAGCSRAQLVDYRGVLRKLNDYLKRDALLSDLRDELVEQFYAALLGEGLRVVTVNRYCRIIIRVWKWAYRKERVAKLPGELIATRKPKSVPDAWSVEELSRILRACAERGGVVGTRRRKNGIGRRTTPAKLFWPLLVLFLYDTGLRLKAALSLRTTDYDAATGIVRVPAEFQKNKQEGRFWLHAETRRLIEQCGGAGFLIPGWQDAHTLHRHYREILNAAGLPCEQRDLFHKLRRTSATHLTDQTDVETARRHLQHEDAETTRGYIDPSKVRSTLRIAEILPRPEWRVAQA